MQESEKLWLHVERQVAYLIDEEGAARGRPDYTGRICYRAGKGAAAIAEQVALRQLPGYRRAVEGYEYFFTTRREHVNGARHQLLARAGLARNQHSHVGRANLVHFLNETSHDRTGMNKTGHEARAHMWRLVLLVVTLAQPLAGCGQVKSYFGHAK